MLESMLSGTGSGGGAFGALQKLLKSGIPGLENLFGQNPDGSLKYAKIPKNSNWLLNQSNSNCQGLTRCQMRTRKDSSKP